MPKPELILKTVRNDKCDMQFFGFVRLLSKKKCLFKKGEGTHFFLRSLAKPFQASIATDFGTYDYYDFTDEEIAVTSASHAGEKRHTDLVSSILSKAGLSLDCLKCGCHEPIGEHNNTEPVNNNCSGKHALMLAVSKQMGWDLDDYLDFEHPVQKSIYKKQSELCECKDFELVPSLDGCNAPVWAMPLENIAKGYLNLFLNDKYLRFKNAFIKNPLIIGGKNRQDSKIIMQGKGNLIAKVGAGGFLAVVNLACQEVLVLKMAQDNNTPREILAQKLLKELNWIEKEECEDKIFTNSGIEVAHFEKTFEIN